MYLAVMAKRRTLLDNLDAYSGGQLSRELLAWRDQGISYDDMSVFLRDQQIIVTGETVRLWFVARDAA